MKLVKNYMKLMIVRAKNSQTEDKVILYLVSS